MEGGIYKIPSLNQVLKVRLQRTSLLLSQSFTRLLENAKYNSKHGHSVWQPDDKGVSGSMATTKASFRDVPSIDSSIKDITAFL